MSELGNASAVNPELEAKYQEAVAEVSAAEVALQEAEKEARGD